MYVPRVEAVTILNSAVASACPALTESAVTIRPTVRFFLMLFAFALTGDCIIPALRPPRCKPGGVAHRPLAIAAIRLWSDSDQSPSMDLIPVASERLALPLSALP